MKPIEEATWMEYLQGTLAPEETAALEQRMAADPALAEEWEEIRQTWSLLEAANAIPEPSSEMDLGFEAMLAEHKATPTQRTLQERVQALLGTWVVPRWALGALLLLVGFGLGRLLGPTASNQAEMAALTQEVQNMQEMMMLTLLEQPAAQDRMRAVSMSQSLPKADSKVIEALVHTLHTDDNVNVRLVAVEALAQYAEQPIARMGLIEAVAKQDSPLVQVALAEVMLQLGDTQAVPAFQQLLEKPELDTTVQEFVQETIDKLS